MKKLLIIIFTLTLVGCGIDSDKGSLDFNVTKPEANSLKKEKELDKSAEVVETDAAYLNLRVKLFDASCMKCHNPESVANALKRNPDKKPRIDLSKKQTILDNFDDILYSMTAAFEVGHDFMPPKGKGEKVSDQLILKFKAWKEANTF